MRNMRGKIIAILEIQAKQKKQKLIHLEGKSCLLII